jgi:hypothetical protein
MDITRFHERWPNTRPTSPATCDRRIDIDANHGESGEDGDRVDGKVDLLDVIVIEKSDGDKVEKLEFQVVQLVEDEDGEEYAVAYSEAADEFVITDGTGQLLEDNELAQEILDEFLILAEESEIEKP